MAKPAVKSFIEIMYGTVSGVSFFYVFGSDSFRDALCRIENSRDVIEFFSDGKLRFTILLFLFTLVILAHDWVSYAKKTRDDKISFVSELPQLLALFFIAQMFAAASNTHLVLWYFYALGYTVANILSFVSQLIMGSLNRLGQVVFWLVAYMIHLSVSYCGFRNTYAGYASSPSTQWTYLGATFGIVVAIWVTDWALEKYCFKKQPPGA